MEDTHRVGRCLLLEVLSIVLILVLMEDTHRAFVDDFMGWCKSVLILVLMEDTHRVLSMQHSNGH